MTILDNLIDSINAAIKAYEYDNRRSLPIERAKEIDEVKAELDLDHTALTLRRSITQKIEEMPGTPLGLPIFLDWNGFRKKMRTVLDNKKFSLLNILIAENREMQLDRISLSKMVAELGYKIEMGAGGPNPLISQLENQVILLEKKREEDGLLCQKYQAENGFLSTQLSLMEKERDHYKQQCVVEAEKSKQLYDKLMQKMAELSDAQSKLEALENKEQSSANTNDYTSAYSKLYRSTN